jgi:ribonuclease D
MPLRVKKKMTPSSAVNYTFIDTQEALAAMAAGLADLARVAIDLEADSLYHFREKVCLIQIGSCRGNWIVDPLQLEDLSVLKPLFHREDVQKIFHGADYDIRSLYRDFGIEIRNLFDTELAGRFLGLRETGLDAVLQNRLGVSLDKKYQKKDWSKRPLPPEMIAYAAGDVFYLLPLAELLEAELVQKERLDWVQEECAILSTVRPPVSDNEPLFLRFRGAGRLGPRSLAVLEALLQLRKTLAEARDRPPFKIVGNDCLMKLAIEKPLELSQLEKLKILSVKQHRIYGRNFVETIEKTLLQPVDNLARYPRKRAPSIPPAIPKRVRALRAWRDARAKNWNIDPAMLLNKALMTTLALKNPLTSRELNKVTELKQWQKRALGNEIIRVLNKVR